MNMRQISCLILIFFLFGCAETEDTEMLTSEKLVDSMYAYAAMSSGTIAYCSIQFRHPENGSVYALEEGSIVSCGGVAAALSGNYYYSYFPHSAGEQVLVSIVRPKAGATAIKLVDLQ